VDLDGVAAHLLCHFAGKQLGHGRFFQAGLARVAQRGGVASERRAASICVAMSANLKPTAWWLKMGWPKLSRSLAYFNAHSKALRAMPTLCAAMPMRPPSSALRAIL
jgi:hypothetical protein